jgi:hypothetical protein
MSFRANNLMSVSSRNVQYMQTRLCSPPGPLDPEGQANAHRVMQALHQTHPDLMFSETESYAQNLV